MFNKVIKISGHYYFGNNSGKMINIGDKVITQYDTEEYTVKRDYLDELYIEVNWKYGILAKLYLTTPGLMLDSPRRYDFKLHDVIRINDNSNKGIIVQNEDNSYSILSVQPLGKSYPHVYWNKTYNTLEELNSDLCRYHNVVMLINLDNF